MLRIRLEVVVSVDLYRFISLVSRFYRNMDTICRTIIEFLQNLVE